MILNSLLPSASTYAGHIDFLFDLIFVLVGVPFLIASLALDRFLQTFKRFRRWIPIVEKASGVLLIVLGFLLLTGQFTVLAAWLNRYTPAFILERI